MWCVISFIGGVIVGVVGLTIIAINANSATNDSDRG
jgi:hypothetical protein